MNTQREFLNIPDGEAISIILKYNSGLLRNGQFGKYFIYTVIHNGEEKLLKVTERLEKQFRNQDVQAGQEIQIRKDSVTPKQGEPYNVINLVREESSQTPPAHRSPDSFHRDVGGNLELLPKQRTSNEMQLLQESLNDAQAICQSSDDATTTVIVAVGLFLSRSIRPLLEQSVQSKRQPFVRRTRPLNGKDKSPIENTQSKDDDLPF